MRTGLWKKGLAFSTIALLVALASVPVSAQVVDARIGADYACSGLTGQCIINTSGFHQGTAGMVGTSSVAGSNGFCAITLTACLSKGNTVTVPGGSCWFATASTQLGLVVVASDSGSICFPAP